MVVKKKKNMLLICIVMVMTILFCGCSENSGNTAPDDKTVISCTITVEDFCSDKAIEISEGGTVYDVLKATGAELSARKSTHGLYIEGINGRFEFDEGPTSGWVYTVNDERATVSCDEYQVEADDVIVWEYVINYEE